jgi:hypothetical protein
MKPFSSASVIFSFNSFLLIGQIPFLKGNGHRKRVMEKQTLEL